MTRVTIDYATEQALIVDGSGDIRAKFPVDIRFPDRRRFGYMELIDVLKEAEERFVRTSPEEDIVWRLDLNRVQRDPHNQWPLQYHFHSEGQSHEDSNSFFIRYTFDSEGRMFTTIVDRFGRVVEDLGGLMTNDEFQSFEYWLGCEDRGAEAKGYEAYGDWTVSWMIAGVSNHFRSAQHAGVDEREEFIRESREEFGADLDDDFDDRVDELFPSDESDDVGYKFFAGVRPCRFVGKPTWTPEWE